MADLTLNQLIDQFAQTRDKLSETLEYTVYDLDDHRSEPWNGDVKYPKWGPFVDEWEYTAYGRHHFKRDGFTFIQMVLSTGDNTLAVFSDANIEEHEEC